MFDATNETKEHGPKRASFIFLGEGRGVGMHFYRFMSSHYVFDMFPMMIPEILTCAS